MIERVRDYPSAAELAAMYRHPTDASRWPEHVLRCELTIALARDRFPVRNVVVDLSAGDGRVARALSTREVVLGDLAAGEHLHLVGPLEQTIGELPPAFADVFVLGETLEHVDDPELVLRLIRRHARGLVLSTPLNEPAGVNPEHVWRWDLDGIRELLDATGWHPTGTLTAELELGPHWPAGYRVQVWTAEAR